jgi:hypothetical protein
LGDLIGDVVESELYYVPTREFTESEDEDRRRVPVGWLLVVVDLTGLLVLAVRLFAERPREEELANVFEGTRTRWNERCELDDPTPVPLTLEFGFGLEGRDGALKQRTVLRGTQADGPILEPPGWMPGRAPASPHSPR